MPRLLLLLFLLCAALPGSGAAAADWRMDLVQSTNTVLVCVQSPPVISDELLKLLRTGVSVSLRYQFEFYPASGLPIYVFPLKAVTWTKTLEYDLAADVYVLTSPAGVVKDDNLRDVLDRFYRPDLVALAPGGLAEFQSRYRTRGRARLETIKLYPPLSLIFGLIDIYNFTTPWTVLEAKAER